jgi:hypothetical protein
MSLYKEFMENSRDDFGNEYNILGIVVELLRSLLEHGGL